jgi:hypothetical protein
LQAASPETGRSIRQFVSEGLVAGDIVDVFKLAGAARPDLDPQ